MSDQRASPARRIQHKLWVVERTDFKELLTDYFDGLPGYLTRAFSPTGVLEALKSKQEFPDVLVTAFYFDGGVVSGLRVLQELRRIVPTIPGIIISGFPSAHVRGAAADYSAWPYCVIEKTCEGFLQTLRGAIEELGSGQSARGSAQSCWACGPLEPLGLPKHRGLRKRTPARQISARRSPLIHLVGNSNCLPKLRAHAEEMASIRFKTGCHFESFTNETCAWTRLSRTGTRPDAVFTDYYLSGGFINGLKLIRHAQNTAPGVLTVLVGDGYSRLHIQGAIQATGISPDWFFPE